MVRSRRVISSLLVVHLIAVPMAEAQEPSPEELESASRIGRRLAQEAIGESREFFGEPVGEDSGLIIAEGDSWFDYREVTWRGLRRSDILKVLETRHGYEVRSTAHYGHTLESMTYDVFQLAELAQEVERAAVRDPERLRAILISAGGNDIAGPELGVLLNHQRAEAGVANEQILSAILDQRLESAWITLLSAITTISEELLGRRIPVLVHGYEYPVPDGRGWHGGTWVLPGPWLEPSFSRKGWFDLEDNRDEMRGLINRYNRVLERVILSSGFAHVRYLRTAGALASTDYKDDWVNELHPTSTGFRRIAGCFHRVIERITAGDEQQMYVCSEL
jgi:hypothetical protein